MKNPIRTPVISATAAARDFSALLDQIEAGAEFLIERHAAAVARIGPAHPGPRKLSECLAVRLARPSLAPDRKFAADLRKIRAGYPRYAPPSWA
ncbi:MAG TPA: hypothetical protein VNF74_07495 [Terriglobales bacterium]|nr:hypothetical protein [Terriglobales bacterium]